jgi:hypothetical protein
MMRKTAGIALFVLPFVLASCGRGAPPLPPLNAIQPEGIDYFVIKSNKLYGGGCNFVADGGGMNAIVLAQEKEAIVKLDGKIVRIPADTGSQLLPETSRTRYADAAHILILAPVPGGRSLVNGVVQSLDTRLMITDAHGRTQFAAKGQVQCKPM